MANELKIIVEKSGLEPTKGKFILEKFQDYFEIAAEWEKKAKAIVVTSPTQEADMERAREGRLILKDKRIALEKARKELKEQALREGKAIDGIANVLKALIIPIEEHLYKQENFVKIQEEEKREAHRLEVEKRMEEERIAAEKKAAREQERIKRENTKLKKEAEERDKKAAEEKKRQEEKLAKHKTKTNKEKEALEEKNRKEREASEEKAHIERDKVRAEREANDEKIRKANAKAKEKSDKEREEKERLEKLLKNEIKCPKCGHKFQREEKS